MLGFILNLFIILVAGLAQSMSLIVFNGVRPNLILAILMVLVFYESDFFNYFLMVALAVMTLQFDGFMTSVQFIFGITMLMAFYFKKYLSENVFVQSFLLILISTSVFYLITDAGYIINHFNTYFVELFYNVLIGLIFGLLYKHNHGKR